MSMITEASLYRLMSWLSPFYPVGGFSYSHGLDYAVEAGLVRDARTLRLYVETVLAQGAGRSDAAIFVAAWRAAGSGDKAPKESPPMGERGNIYRETGEDDSSTLSDIADLALAWRGSREMALESEAQGTAFLATTAAAWPAPLLEEFARNRTRVAFPVAVAVASAAHRIPLEASLAAYLHAFASNLVSAGMRLVPLGQSDGQDIVAKLEPAIAACGKDALTAALDTIGTAAPLIDWCSMRHETQYTRLFRS